MIKARKGGLLILGIEEANVRKLKAYEPIYIAGGPALEGERISEIVIFYGKDFQELVDQMKLAGAIPADLEVTQPQPRTKP